MKLFGILKLKDTLHFPTTRSQEIKNKYTSRFLLFHSHTGYCSFDFHIQVNICESKKKKKNYTSVWLLSISHLCLVQNIPHALRKPRTFLLDSNRGSLLMSTQLSDIKFSLILEFHDPIPTPQLPSNPCYFPSIVFYHSHLGVIKWIVSQIVHSCCSFWLLVFLSFSLDLYFLL